MVKIDRLKSVISALVLNLVIAALYLQFNTLHAAEPQQSSRISPKIWLETKANEVLDEIDLKRPAFDKDQMALERYIYIKTLPLWDSRLMARGLGGIAFRHASRKIQNKLEQQWKLTLIRYFLKAFPFYSRQRLHLDDDQNCVSKSRCWLTTEVKIAGKEGVDLAFYVRWHGSHSKPAHWQIIDMRVAGVSLLKHKRGETRAVLKQQGLEGVIAALKDKNAGLQFLAEVSGD